MDRKEFKVVLKILSKVGFLRSKSMPKNWVQLDLEETVANQICSWPEPIHDSHNVRFPANPGSSYLYTVSEKTGPVIPDSPPEIDPYAQLPLTPSEESKLVGRDLSRLPPRVFRTIPAALQSLRKEIDGLLKKNSSGEAALKEVDLNDPSIQKLPSSSSRIWG